MSQVAVHGKPGAVTWRSQHALASTAALFLDRDGVINDRVARYVLRVSDLRLSLPVVRALMPFCEREIPIVIVSNQSCVGRGLISEPTLRSIMAFMVSELTRYGVHLSAWYCCPHMLEEDCDCRKPKPGLLLQCSRDLGIDLKKSWLIGDEASDVAAGRAAGCLSSVLYTGDVSVFGALAQIAEKG